MQKRTKKLLLLSLIAGVLIFSSGARAEVLGIMPEIILPHLAVPYTIEELYGPSCSDGWLLETESAGDFTTYTYDDHDNLLHEYTEEWQGGEFDCEYLHTYDSRDNRIETIARDWVATRIYDWRYLYTYDANDNMIGMEIEEGVGSGTYWYLKHWYDGTYDSKNNLIEVVHGEDHEYYGWEDRNTYAYDDDNRLIEMIESERFRPATEWDLLHKTVYIYDGGNLVQKEEYRYVDGEWVDYSWKYVYEYDTYNNLTTAECFNLDLNGEFYPYERWFYSYPAGGGGYIVERLDERYISGEWIEEDRDSYLFDWNGNLLEWVDYRYGESHHVYAYDMYDNRIEHINDGGTNRYYTYRKATVTDPPALIDFYDLATVVSIASGHTEMDYFGELVYGAAKRLIWENAEQYASLEGKRFILTYNPDTTLAYATAEIMQDGAWVNYQRCEFVYDETYGLLTYLRDQIWQDDSWVIRRNHKVIYNPDGTVQWLKALDFYNGGWHTVELFYFRYDAEGRLSYVDARRHDGTKWVTEISNAIHYNADGSLMDIKAYLPPIDGGNWRPFEAMFFEYDAEGRLSYLEGGFWDDIRWLIMKSYPIHYNADGSLKDVSLDVKFVGWMPIEQCVYSYDALGLIDGLTAQVWDGSSWQTTIDYDVIYEFAFPFMSLSKPKGDLATTATVGPNPFNPVTTLTLTLPESELVTVKVYNIQGMEVAELVNDHLEAGNHNFTWDASGNASGIYLMSVKSGDFTSTQKVMLVK